MTDDLMQMPPVSDIEVVALAPHEMAEGQAALIEWCHKKIVEVGSEIHDAQQRIEVTKNSALACDVFVRQVERGKRELTYYQKLLEAFRAGYIVVPNFPIQAFAVRTNRHRPQSKAFARWPNQVPDQTPVALAQGEGRYVHPEPLVAKEPGAIKGAGTDGKDLDGWFAINYQEIRFPVAVVKPKVLAATQSALALKLFDEVGLVGQQPKKDPIVIGRIYRPGSKSAWSARYVSFFVAWWLNTRAL